MRFFLFGCVVAGVAGAPVGFADNPLDGIAQEVTIRRTAHGVPHILAANERAAGFGMGYVQAEDHAEKIMKHIWRARGRMAEVFGGDDNLESDLENRQFRVYERAVDTFHLLDADFRALLEGYALGFSYYVLEHRDTLEGWYEPITPHDVAAHGLTGVQRFAFDRGNIIRSFLRKADAGEDVVVEPDEETMGSNMWAFAPSRTTSGHAILMGNPHQAWSDVATYYEAHITIPGTYNFYGTTFVGRPVLTTGFNANLGWTHTVNYPDLEEIYALDLDPKRPNHYLFDGGSVPLKEDTHRVKVRTDAGMLEVKRTFWHTPLGPVIHRTQDQVFVLRSAAYEEFRFYQQWYRMGQASNWVEFQEALAIGAMPMFNTGYADKEGNIYYLWNGSIPNLPHARQRDVAVHAHETNDIWTQFHDLKELPQWLNPEGGYVFNSNSAPYLTNLHSPVKREDFPAHFPDNRLSLRSQNSLLLIHNDEQYSLEDVVEMKHDMGALLADRVKDDLIAAVLRSEPDAELRKAVQRLYGWDNTVSRDSRGSVLFKTWWGVYSKDEEGGNRDAEENYAVVWSEDAPISTPNGLADWGRAVTALRAAMTDLDERYGTWDVAWGDVHRLRRGDLDVPVGGDGNALGCFRIIDYRQADDGKFVARRGDSAIMAVEFGETPRAYTVVAYSQSGNADSPYHTDQSVLFADNRLKPVAFTEEDIEQSLVAEYIPGGERAPVTAD